MTLAQDLHDALLELRRSGYQQMYNGRPSCPFCDNFVDDEETHDPDCILLRLRKSRRALPSAAAAGSGSLPDGVGLADSGEGD